MRYRCKICGKKFVTKHSVRFHVIGKHGKVEAVDYYDKIDNEKDPGRIIFEK